MCSGNRLQLEHAGFVGMALVRFLIVLASLMLVERVLRKICIDVNWIGGGRKLVQTVVRFLAKWFEEMLICWSLRYVEYDLGNSPKANLLSHLLIAKKSLDYIQMRKPWSWTGVHFFITHTLNDGKQNTKDNLKQERYGFILLVFQLYMLKGIE